MPFDLLDYPIVTLSPAYMTIDPGSAWVGHIPFGMAAVQMLRPRQLVELGTHGGDSYCAFCRAVQALDLDTRCSAVDTWTGDAHAGVYGSAVFDNLRAFHDANFGRFSRLLRMTFDRATAEFADGSVDLLHIDGMHTYEAVRHDFETWLPKMSDRGVILFHDVAVREKDFGVWRLWDEVRAGRRHFAFDHSSGLGVLAVGTALPRPANEFFDAADRAPQIVRALFAQLGGAIVQSVILRNTVVSLIRLQAGMNEWNGRTGHPVDPPRIDPQQAFGECVPFAQRLCDQVRVALVEDLQLRHL